MKNVLLVLSRECSHAGQFRARVSASAIGNVDIPFPLNLFKYARSSQDHQLDLVRLPLEALVPVRRGGASSIRVPDAGHAFEFLRVVSGALRASTGM